MLPPGAGTGCRSSNSPHKLWHKLWRTAAKQGPASQAGWLRLPSRAPASTQQQGGCRAELTAARETTLFSTFFQDSSTSVASAASSLHSPGAKPQDQPASNPPGQPGARASADRLSPGPPLLPHRQLAVLHTAHTSGCHPTPPHGHTGHTSGCHPTSPPPESLHQADPSSLPPPSPHHPLASNHQSPSTRPKT